MPRTWGLRAGAQLSASFTVENLPKTTPWPPRSIIESSFDDSGSRPASGHFKNINYCWAQVGSERRGWTRVTADPALGEAGRGGSAGGDFVGSLSLQPEPRELDAALVEKGPRKRMGSPLPNREGEP